MNNPQYGPARGPLKTLCVVILGAISGLYLINPGAGIFELLPDNLPILGNLDEAATTLVFLNCLAYFGIDLRHLFSSGASRSGRSPELGDRK